MKKLLVLSLSFILLFSAVAPAAASAADGGEKDHSADLERTAVMLLFVAERAGHAAAAAMRRAQAGRGTAATMD